MFESGSADYGAGVYLSQFNDRAVFDSTAVRHNDAYIQGGGLFLLASDVQMINTVVSSNSAPTGGGLYTRSSKVSLTSCVVDNNIGGTFGGAFFQSSASATVTNTRFDDNTAGSGGALGLFECARVLLTNCTFDKNTAKLASGGAVLARLSSVNVSDCSFSNNGAQESGGGVYLTETGHSEISSSRFDGNTAATGDGSAVWISGSANIAVADNAFSGNVARRGGGTVYWVSSSMPEPPGVRLRNTFFSSNSALYGSDVATDSYKLSLFDSDINVTDYSQPIPRFNVTVVDYYDHVVRSEASAVLVASVLSSAQCFESVGYVTGGFIEPFVSGAVRFSTLLAYCDPGYSMAVSLTSNVDGIQLQSSVDLWFRPCVTGEYYTDSVCAPCEPGTYSVVDPSEVDSLSDLTQKEVCKPCPDEASSCYKDTMVLSEGHWRISEESTSILSCPFEGSCGGGSGTGDALCTEGYEGKV